MATTFSKYKIYGVFGYLRLIYYLIRTKLCFPGARLIRFPIEIRGKRYIDFGKQLTTGKYCRIEAYPQDHESILLHFGNNVQINDMVHITAMEGVFIGDNVLMASKIYISDSSHGLYSGESGDSDPAQPPQDRDYRTAPVHIGNNVWIGESVSVLPGVTIGDGSIIGANSVVTKSIPGNSIAVGIPARVIKTFNSEKKFWENNC